MASARIRNHSKAHTISWLFEGISTRGCLAIDARTLLGGLWLCGGLDGEAEEQQVQCVPRGEERICGAVSKKHERRVGGVGAEARLDDMRRGRLPRGRVLVAVASKSND